MSNIIWIVVIGFIAGQTAPGIDHQKQNLSNVGRPIRLVAPGTEAVKEALL